MKNVVVKKEAGISVIPFAVPLDNEFSIGQRGVVGTIILLRNSALIWIGWGEIDMHPGRDVVGEAGKGRPPQAGLCVAMPMRNLGDKGAFRSSSDGPSSCSQIIGSSNSENQMLGNQMACRLTTRLKNFAILVSVELSEGSDDGGLASGFSSESVSHQAAAMAEKEIWKILQSHNVVATE